MAQSRADIHFGDNDRGLQLGQNFGHVHIAPGEPAPGVRDERRDADKGASLERPETPPKPSSNVPFRRDPDFVERAGLNEQIDAKLSVPAGRLALVGFGGVGKSQLAIEFCHRLRQQSPETWVLWIHASNAARFGQSVQDVADQLKLFGRKEAEADILQLLRNRLRDASKGRWLIVLDNVDDAGFLLEPPVAATQRRIDYIPPCDHGSMIITSRSEIEALKLVYESDTIDVQPMSGGDAEALLEKKLGKLGTQAENRQLATALDRIPLAITQAAPFIKQRTPRCSVQQYCQEIEQSRTSRTGLLRRELHLPSRDAEATNSVMLTWQISFEHIYRMRRSAAELLSLMSFCDRLAIPEILLRQYDTGEVGASPSDLSSPSDVSSGNSQKAGPSHDNFEEDIVTLRSFSFISATASPYSWEMHRLVQDATQIWLEDHGRLSEFLDQFVHHLYRSFPNGTFETWPWCRVLFPHVKCAAERKPTHIAALSDWASVMYFSAWYALEQSNFTDALAMATSSMEIKLKQLGEEDRITMCTAAMAANAQRLNGHLTEAEQIEIKLVETSRVVLGAEHPDTLLRIANLALTYLEQERYTEAERQFIKVIELKKAVFGAEGYHTLTSMHNLALTYAAQGRLTEAEQLLLSVLEARKVRLGAEHPETLLSMGHLASTYKHQGRLTEAEQLFVKVVEVRKVVTGAEHPGTLLSMAELASTYSRQQRWAESEELRLQVVAGRKKVLGPQHPDTLSAVSNLEKFQRKRRRTTSKSLAQQQSSSGEMQRSERHRDSSDAHPEEIVRKLQRRWWEKLQYRTHK